MAKCKKATPITGWPSRKNVRRRPTLPQPLGCSTIGAERLDFRVRDGTGYFPLAKAAVTLAGRPTGVFTVGSRSYIAFVARRYPVVWIPSYVDASSLGLQQQVSHINASAVMETAVLVECLWDKPSVY